MSIRRRFVTCPLPEVFSAELSSLSGNCDAGNSIDFETTCIFECSIGYNVIGGEDVSCQSDGELSALIPTCAVVSCSIPELPPRLSPMASQCNAGLSINYTESCSYSCDVGYNLVGSASVTCLANKSLSDVLPSCEVETCNVPQLPPKLSSSCTERQSVAYNTTCEFSCNIGYDLLGMSYLHCLANGTFSDDIPTCEIISCFIPDLQPRLSPLTSQCNGGLSINYTESCSYSCDVGYNLVGSPSVSCLANTSLSDFLPQCEVKTCDIPQLPPTLLTSCPMEQPIVYNTSCEFSCFSGYNITGTPSLDCLANGTLSGDIPTCQEINECLSVPCQNGAQCVDRIDDYNCYCEPGWTGRVCDQDINECQSNPCVFGQCGHGINFYFCNCNAGYNGTNCNIVKTCNVPQLPPNLSSLCTEGQNVAYNTTCEFSCNIGYDLIGMSSLACLANGTFSDDIPTCQIVSCSIPELLPRLSPMASQCNGGLSINYTESCSYSCDVGYNLVGSASVTCLANTSLSDFLPSCEVVTCNVPQLPPNLSSSCTEGQNVAYNTTCAFSCNIGYDLIGGMSSLACLANGTFSDDILTCQTAEPCASSPCLNGGTCTTSDDGASYVCTCAESYTDVNCNTQIREQGPLAVFTNPLSQMVDVEARVTFSCSFQNAQSYRWYKDSVPILGSENRSPLVINPALAEDQGYYYCTAVGEEGPPRSTNQALLTVNGVDNYVVVASFNKTFNSSLSERTSSYFQQLSKELINFILTPLQNNFEATVAVGVNSFSPGSVITEFGIYVYNGSIPDGEQLSIISSTITSLAEGNPNFLDPASVQSFSAVTCPAGTYVTNYGYVAMFDSGVIYSTANSTDTKCPDYTVYRDHRVKATCVGDTLRACVWEPKMNCGKNLTADELLKIIIKAEVTAENAEMIVEEVAEITSMTETLSTEGLEIVADILKNITDISSTDVQVTESVVDIASNIADLPEGELEMAEASGAPSRVVIALEAQLAVVEVLNETLRIVEPNIAAEVLDLTVDGLSQGITVFMSATADGGSISDEDFQVARGDRTTKLDALEAQATLFIPSVLAKRFSGLTDRRMVITTHLNTALFRDSGLTEFNLNQTGFLRKLNSRIIAASINNEEIENLEEPVMIAFTPTNPNGTNATCVSYDFDDNQWSTRGCIKTSNDNIYRITCECDHLTNFGILMDIYGGEGLSPQEDFILEIISYVGCCMSIWGLVITILTYAFNKKLRDRKPNQILLPLSSSLLCLYIVFLVMISVDTE
eukprot:XP_011662474.1 PREDICTED: uncharacterized protein LOC105437510 [Strongylocentrotus purpuratus]